jgi:ribosomal protein L32E
MVWLVEKKVVHHMFVLGFERVKIPVRVKFEFEVKAGAFVPDSLSTYTVYNRKALERRYPKLNLALLESSVSKTVKNEIMTHLRECGFLCKDHD